jgi:Rrf2 family protein
MRLSKKGEYALRAMIALSRSSDAAMTITQIATSQDLPKKFLEQILLALKSAGLVRSKAGPKGGYELAESARAITVGRILGAVEEPISHSRASASGENLAPTGVIALLDDIRCYVRNKLETVSLQEIADEALSEQDVEALMWYI